MGAIVAWSGPKLEPLVRGVWAELSESARQRQTDVLFWAIHNGIPVDEMEKRINASERAQLLTGFTLSAATRTAWENKVRALGRSLASGLLANDNTKIDTEQLIIAAVADIEGPQLAMLELLVCWEPDVEFGTELVIGPLKIPEYSHDPTRGGSWHVGLRRLSGGHIACARPNLAPIAPSLLGTLQRHGLVGQNDDVSNPRSSAPHRTWSPTELGEQVFIRFRDAGTELPDVWASGPTDQAE